MAKAFKTCKVCGAEYEYCHTLRRADGIFRWQDVACCPEHGSVYLSRIMASRETAEAKGDTDILNDVSGIVVDEDEDDEYDELFEEDFEDDPEEDYEEDTICY